MREGKVNFVYDLLIDLLIKTKFFYTVSCLYAKYLVWIIRGITLNVLNFFKIITKLAK